MSYIYLGSPYSHHDPAMRHQRYRQVGRAAAHLIREGLIVYSPIVHCHLIAREFGLPKEFEFWERFDYAMLEPAGLLMVLKLPGWEESRGLTAEMAFARKKEIPLKFMDWPITP